MGLCCGVDLKPMLWDQPEAPCCGINLKPIIGHWNEYHVFICLVFNQALSFVLGHLVYTHEVLSRFKGLIRIKSLDEQKLICIWDLETNRNFQKQEWAYLRSYFLKATTALVLNINRLVVRAVQRDQPPLLWYEAVKTNK